MSKLMTRLKLLSQELSIAKKTLSVIKNARPAYADRAFLTPHGELRVKSSHPEGCALLLPFER
jgi:hypothetical protein